MTKEPLYSAYPPAPIVAIENLEKKLQASLPPILRSVYAQSNGGKFPDPLAPRCIWVLNPILDTSDKKRMRRTARDIWYYTQAKFNPLAIPQRIVIATCGNLKELYVKRDELTGQISEEIFLLDPDSEIFDKPYALNLQDAINQIRIPEIVQPDPTRALPVFRYYADPISSGAIQLSSERCDCCRKNTGYIYKANYGFSSSGKTKYFCPWCIANGKAAAKFRGEFNQWEWIGMGEVALPQDVIAEIAFRTPGFLSYQTAQWWAHCGDAARFLGELWQVDPLLLQSEKALAFTQTIREELGYTSDKDWQLFLSKIGPNWDPTIFAFECLHCGKLGGYFDYS